eukprot:1625948-Rhodomonas_salina.1
MLGPVLESLYWPLQTRVPASEMFAAPGNAGAARHVRDCGRRSTVQTAGACANARRGIAPFEQGKNFQRVYAGSGMQVK